MYHIVPMCCACLKTNKSLIKLSKNNVHLLDRLLTNPLDFEHLKVDIPLYICKICNDFLEKIHRFQNRVTETANKIKGYVRQLKMGNNYVPTSFSNVSVTLNQKTDVNKLKNDLIIAKQPIVRLEKTIEVEPSLKVMHYSNDFNENIEETAETVDDDNIFIDTSQILDVQCVTEDESSSENCSFYEYNSSDENDDDFDMEYYNTGILRSQTPEITIPPSAILVKNIRNKLASILEKNNDQTANETLVTNEEVKNEMLDIEENGISDDKIKDEFDVLRIKSET